MNFAAYAGALLLLVSCSTKKKESSLTTTTVVQSPAKTNPMSTTVTTIKSSTASQNTVIDAGKWLYDKRVDKEGRMVYKAFTHSPTVLKTAFPYTGNAIATLTIRKRVGSDTHLYIQLANGQFNRSFQGGQVRIRFDTGPSKLYSFSAAENGSANIIFFDAIQPLIQKLKAAQTMRVDVEFTGLGYQQVEFRIAGLTWTH